MLKENFSRSVWPISIVLFSDTGRGLKPQVGRKKNVDWNLMLVVTFLQQCQGNLASLKEVKVTKIKISACEKFLQKE